MELLRKTVQHDIVERICGCMHGRITGKSRACNGRRNHIRHEGAARQDVTTLMQFNCLLSDLTKVLKFFCKNSCNKHHALRFVCSARQASNAMWLPAWAFASFSWHIICDKLRPPPKRQRLSRITILDSTCILAWWCCCTSLAEGITHHGLRGTQETKRIIPKSTCCLNSRLRLCSPPRAAP